MRYYYRRLLYIEVYHTAEADSLMMGACGVRSAECGVRKKKSSTLYRSVEWMKSNQFGLFSSQSRVKLFCSHYIAVEYKHTWSSKGFFFALMMLLLVFVLLLLHSFSFCPYADDLPGANGVIVLGMHRSGTSLMTGLLSISGFQTGGPLTPPLADNPLGFFERIDVTKQNVAFLKRQGSYCVYNTNKYQNRNGLELFLSEIDENNENNYHGKLAIAFMNDASNFPWVVKDPRFCITLQTWLPLLSSQPDIVFVYRNPLDVAGSLYTRDHRLSIDSGLRLWYVHNKRAIRQSKELCRSIVSHHELVYDPILTLLRVQTELEERCKLDVPRKLCAYYGTSSALGFDCVSDEEVLSFSSIELHHLGFNNIDKSCTEGAESNVDILINATIIRDVELYLESMRVYCAIEDRTAFSDNFYWNENIIDNVVEHEVQLQ